jgi:hypothetical protein
MKMAGLSVEGHLDIKGAARDGAAFTGWKEAGILYGVFEEEQDAGVCSGVAFVDQDSAALEEVSVPFEREVEDCVKQRVPGTNECRQRLSWGRDEVLFEYDSFVTG